MINGDMNVIKSIEKFWSRYLKNDSFVNDSYTKFESNDISEVEWTFGPKKTSSMKNVSYVKFIVFLSLVVIFKIQNWSSKMCLISVLFLCFITQIREWWIQMYQQWVCILLVFSYYTYIYNEVSKLPTV